MIHETGHILTGRAFGECYAQLDLSPLGGMITYKSGRASCKGLRGALIAASGPMCNVFAILLYLYSPVLRECIPHKAGQVFILMNASMAFVNLIPVLPLDGGRILFSIGYCCFPLSVLTSVLTAAGRFFGMCCVILALFGAIRWEKLNISLLLAGMYIAVYAGRQREVIYAGNLHTVLQERLALTKKAVCCQIVCVLPEEQLICLIPYLCRYERIVCLTETEQGAIWIQERPLLTMLIRSPHATFKEAIMMK